MPAVVVALIILVVLLIGLVAVMLGAKALRAEADRVHTTRGAKTGRQD